MAITKNDIKLLKSQRMTDFDDGGGHMTGDAVIDGQSNEIFPDISELDRTYGRVNLREVFPAVLTPTTDAYYGAHFIVEKPPQDQAVDVLAFEGTPAEVRSQARDRIERYVVAGPLGPWFLYETHVEGQRALLLFGRVGVELPEVGDVLYLVENEGQADEFSQYVRVTDVTVETRTFTDNNGEFQRDVITCQIGSPLAYTFHGAQISRYDTISPPCKVRKTLVADAARYFGVKPLAQAAAIGDARITVESIWGQLIPAARSETAITDVRLPYKPVEVTSGSETFEIIGPAHTHSIEVTLANRAYSYVATLKPIPAPKLLTVEYRAQGKWYRIEDTDGSGQLSGAGSGTVNYQTGSVSITLQALPDVGSEIIFTWGATVHYREHSGTTVDPDPLMVFELPGAAVPGSVSISWISGGSTHSATVTAAGEIKDSADNSVIGYLAHSLGRGFISFPQDKYPDSGTKITVNWQEAPAVHHEVLQPTQAGTSLVVTVSHPPIKPGSLTVTFALKSKYWYQGSRKETRLRPAVWTEDKVLRWTSETTEFQNAGQGSGVREFTVTDDGAGNLPHGGTVDYANGTITIPGAYSLSASSNTWSTKNGSWSSQSTTETEVFGNIYVRYIEDTGTPTNRQTQIDVPPLQVKLIPQYADAIIPGTVRFNYGGQSYSDRAGGGLLYLTDGTVAGSIDYEEAIATLTIYSPGNTLTIDSLVSAYGIWYDYQFKFRTAGSPLQPGSLVVSATTLDGNQLIESADQSGYIQSQNAEGRVQQEMGVVSIRFGQLVDDASLTAEEKQEPWYDPNNVDSNGKIWKPKFVFPNSFRHSEVVYRWLPLDASVLGLDPTRLPSDGRVPIYRPGDVVVIHHTAEVQDSAPAANGTFNIGRVRLERVRVYDANGQEVPENEYTVDLEAGQITWGANIGNYTAPLTIQHTIADMALVTDVTIHGELALNRQLTHDFPANESLVSSALLIGDMQARVTNLFDQATWTGEWSDSQIGDPATGTYNEIDYPIQVTNDGAITERWYCRFLNTTEVEIYGETIGGLLNAGENRWSIANDIAPINPATGKPYFVIPAAGWGGGWSTGNVLRFNTIGANFPVWLIRSIQPSSGQGGQSDQFCVQIRGDVNR